MIIGDITFNGEKLETDLIATIPMCELIPIQTQMLTCIRLFLESYDSKEWLQKASVNVLSLLYLKEESKEVLKAKKLRDEKFPKETKREVWKEIFKNPIKSLWLLKLK